MTPRPDKEPELLLNFVNRYLDYLRVFNIACRYRYSLLYRKRKHIRQPFCFNCRMYVVAIK
nr:MAG TPA: hypothetical protein [Caudoviricetes sp.]